MKALILVEPNKMEIRDIPMPEPSPGEVLVRVMACGVCNATDLKVLKGINRYWSKGVYPCTWGHEVTGFVEEIGREVKRIKKGDRVFLRITRTGYAEYCKANESEVKVLPENIGVEEGVLGQLMPIAVRGIEKTVRKGDMVMVVGQGPAGLLCLQTARACGAAKVFVSDLFPERLALAKTLSADACLPADKEDVVERVKELTGGVGVDVAIECGGIAQTFRQCEQVLRKGGGIAVFGTHLKPVELDMVQWESNSWYMYLAREQPHETAYLMDRTAELFASGQVRVREILSHTFPLEKAGEAFSLLEKSPQKCLKISLLPK